MKKIAFIPEHVLTSELSAIEKIIFGLIVINTEEDKWCRITNTEIADVLKITTGGTANIIAKMVDNKILKREVVRDNKKIIIERKLGVWFDMDCNNVIQIDAERPPHPRMNTSPSTDESNKLLTCNQVTSNQVTSNSNLKHNIYNNNINNIYNNNILTSNSNSKGNKAPVKAPLTEEDLEDSKHQLSELEILEISQQYDVMYDDVKDTYESVILSIQHGNKYKLLNVKLATIQWLKRGIRAGQIGYSNPIQREYEMMEHHPWYQEQKRKAMQKFKEEGFIS